MLREIAVDNEGQMGLKAMKLVEAGNANKAKEHQLKTVTPLYKTKVSNYSAETNFPLPLS